MRPRKLPAVWLFTDERAHGLAGEHLPTALRALPRGAGVVFRHYALPHRQRIALARRVAGTARARSLALLVAGPPLPVRATGRHLPRWLPGPAPGLTTRSVHTPAEATRARYQRAALAFVSPVFLTRSHPGAPALGPHGFARLARLARVPAVALGGITAARARRLPAYGFAAVDGLSASSARFTNTASS